MSGRHLVVTVVGTLLCSAAVISSSVSQHSTVYVSVSDRDEIAVKGLTTKDFVVKVDGRDSVVLNTRQASEPIVLAFVINTAWGFAGKRFSSGTSNTEFLRFSRAAVAIVDRLAAAGSELRVGVIGASSKPLQLRSATNHQSDLEAELAHAADTDVLAGIRDAAVALESERTNRRVVFVLSTFPFTGRQVEQAGLPQVLRASGTSVWGIEVGDFIRGGSHAPLAEMAALSGGRDETMTSVVSLEDTAKRLADLLASQYVIAFEVNGQRNQLRVGVARPDVSVAAPAWLRQ